MSLGAILHAIGYATAAAAAVWFFRALLSDRARGRPRCPKCWYSLLGMPPRDLEGRPACVCPECGHAEPCDRRLYRTRRRWRSAVAALVALALAYGVWATPRIQQAGWPGAIPTAGLIIALPWARPADSAAIWGSAQNIPKRASKRYPLYAELARRAEQKELLGWQWWSLAELCLSRSAGTTAQPEVFMHYAYSHLMYEAQDQGHLKNARHARRVNNLVSIKVQTRDRWPIGVPMRLEVGVERWAGRGDARLTFQPAERGIDGFVHFDWSPFVGCGGRAWADDLVAASKLTPGTTSIHYTVGVDQRPESDDPWSARCIKQVMLPVRAVTSVDEIMTPVRAPAIAACFADKFGDQPVFLRYSVEEYDDVRRGRLELDMQPTEAILLAAGNPTLAVNIEILRDGEVVYTRDVWWWITHKHDPAGWMHPCGDILLDWDCEDPMPTDGCWEVHLRGDPIVALRNFECDRYWAGEVTFPAEMWVYDTVNGQSDWRPASETAK